jgi:hypothetical protein
MLNKIPQIFAIKYLKCVKYIKLITKVGLVNTTQLFNLLPKIIFNDIIRVYFIRKV